MLQPEPDVHWESGGTTRLKRMFSTIRKTTHLSEHDDSDLKPFNEYAIQKLLIFKMAEFFLFLCLYLSTWFDSWANDSCSYDLQVCDNLLDCQQNSYDAQLRSGIICDESTDFMSENIEPDWSDNNYILYKLQCSEIDNHNNNKTEYTCDLWENDKFKQFSIVSVVLLCFTLLIVFFLSG